MISDLQELDLTEIFQHKTDELFWYCDADGEIIYVNEAFQTVIGICKKKLSDSTYFLSLIHPDNKEAVRFKYNESLKLQTSYKITYQFKHVSGGYVSIYERAYPIFDKNREFKGFVKYGADVSEAFNNQIKLDLSKSLFDAIFNSQPHAEFIINESQKIISVNLKGEEVVRELLNQNTIIGEDCSVLVDLIGVETFYYNLLKCFEGEVIRFERELLLDKNKNYFEGYFLPIRDKKNKIFAISISFYDCTADKVLKLKLERSQNFIDNSHDYFLVLDKNGVIIDANKALLEFENASYHEYIGKSGITGNSAKEGEIYKRDFMALIEGSSFKNYNVSKLNHKGELTHVFWHSFYDKKTETVFSLGRDVTEKIIRDKEIEKLKAKNYEDSIELIKVRNRYFIKGQEEERARLARDLHDEVGQMLTALKIRVSNLQNNSNSFETNLNDIKLILTETITSVRNISYDIMPNTLFEFGLKRAIESLFESFFRNLNSINFEIKNNLSQKRFSKDFEINIFRIIQEILNNIIKHSNATSVKIHLHETETEFAIFVTDNGNGFNFETVASPPELKLTSGLSSLQQRVDFLDGDLEIESNVGEGCKIKVNLKIKN